jgi:hypothetical protein
VIAAHAVLRLGACWCRWHARGGPGIAFILNQCRACVVIADPVMMMLVPPALADGEPLQRVCLPGASTSDAGCAGQPCWTSLPTASPMPHRARKSRR